MDMKEKEEQVLHAAFDWIIGVIHTYGHTYIAKTYENSHTRGDN